MSQLITVNFYHRNFQIHYSTRRKDLYAPKCGRCIELPLSVLHLSKKDGVCNFFSHWRILFKLSQNNKYNKGYHQVR